MVDIAYACRGGARLLVVAGWALLLAGCPLRPQVKNEEAAEQMQTPPRGLAVQETVSFEFAADGLWHESPYLALNGQRLQFAPGKGAEGLSSQAIRFKVDQMPQMLKERAVIDVTMPGRISFRTENKFVTRSAGPLQVQIKRLK